MMSTGSGPPGAKRKWRRIRFSSRLTKPLYGRSRRQEAQISLEVSIYLEPPHVGCHLIDGLLATPKLSGQDLWFTLTCGIPMNSGAGLAVIPATLSDWFVSARFNRCVGDNIFDEPTDNPVSIPDASDRHRKMQNGSENDHPSVAGEMRKGC